MDVTVARGTRIRYLWQGFALTAILWAVFMLPPLGLLLALTLALAACPALARGDRPFAWALAVTPGVAWLLAGGETAIALWLPLPCCLCLAAVSLGHRRSLPFAAQMLLCAGAFLLAALGMLVRVGDLLGGPLFTQIAAFATRRVEGSLMGGALLYRLADAGLLTIPDAYREVAGLQLGDYVLLNPLLFKELLNMLRLRLDEGLRLWIPTLLMQGALLTGLFTVLFSQRVYARRDGKPQEAPLFRTLRLPRRDRGYVLAICIGILVTSFSGHTLVSLTQTLLYAAFTAVYQLLGAAVTVFLLANRHPTRAPLYGVLAAVLYLLFPLVLFVLGLADQFMNLRASALKHQEEE